MSDPKDFDELRAAWSELEPPTPESTLEQDAETRAAIDWLKAAYDDLQPPVPAIPRHLKVPARRRPLLRWTAALATAAAVLALAFGARELLGQRESGVAPANVLVSDAEPEPEPADAPIAEAPVEPRAPVIHAAFRPDGVEMRSGKVRLILLDTPPPSSQNTLTENPIDQENAR